MSEIRVKTKLQVSPQGKQKVYFISHPEDFELYFETLSDEIIEAKDCAVYYDAKPEEDYIEEDIRNDIKEMQLVVVCVTKKFLTAYSRALLFDFECALGCNVPVLPIMMEEGQESLFNEVCGCLQTISRNAEFEGSFSYKERIKNFISSVLLEDETVEKVRSAFDAYIFLSYRKKDRKVARELMEHIHKNEFMRDVAIWYDEYLVIGENFNTAIENALKKCENFTLLVTTNLLEEGNYVMSTEVPMANSCGKQIIAAHMVKTNRDELLELNKDVEIPKFISAGKDLGKAYKEAFKGINLCSNNSPEHKYYIGLAYLNGIDVEMNLEKGMSLIKESADEGYTDAIKMIIRMYNGGIKVERNTSSVFPWLEKLITEIDSGNADIEAAKDYLFCARQYRIMAKTKETLDTLKKAEAICISALESNKDINILRLLLEIYGLMSEQYRLGHENREVERTYDKYIDAIKNIISIEDTTENRRLLASIYMSYANAEANIKSFGEGRLGVSDILLLLTGNRRKAKKLTKRALHIMKDFEMNSEVELQYLEMIADAYGYGISNKKVSIEEARKKVLSLHDTEVNRLNYAIAKGYDSRSKGKTEFIKSIDEGIHSIENIDSTSADYVRSQLYFRKARLRVKDKEQELLNQDLENAIVSLEKYVRNSKDALKWSKCANIIEDGYAMARRRFITKKGDIPFYNLFAVMYDYLEYITDIEVSEYRFKIEGINYLLYRAYKKYGLERVDDRFYIDDDYSDKFMMAYYSILAYYARKKSDTEAEEDYLRKAIGYYDEQSADVDSRDIVAYCFIRLANIWGRKGEDSKERTALFEKGLNIQKELYGEEKAYFLNIRDRIANEVEEYKALYNQKEWKKALDHVMEVIKLQEEIMTHPEYMVVGDRENLANDYHNAGIMWDALGKSKHEGAERIAAFRNAYSYLEKALKAYSKVQMTEKIAKRISDVNESKGKVLLLMTRKNKTYFANKH